MRNQFLKYDLFKLIVLLVLIILLITLLISPVNAPAVSNEQNDAVVEAVDGATGGDSAAPSLPESPTTNIDLSFDGKTGRLVDDAGTARYRLDESGEIWVPVISDSLIADLPDDYSLLPDDSGDWIITGSGGSVLYRFDSGDLVWMKAEGEAADSEDTEAKAEPAPCDGANPVRISDIGAKVRVVNALIPLRLSPDATSSNYVLSLPEGSVLEIISGPVCTPYLDGANQWWGVRTEEGVEGFAAEGSAVSDIYYLEEIQ